MAIYFFFTSNFILTSIYFLSSIARDYWLLLLAGAESFSINGLRNLECLNRPGGCSNFTESLICQY
ncbi:MAG TPA: hypothetical protein DEA78_18315 [Cyanobacteria bacterium UBA11159]|nr:hypothetical protein [Cyanobacteria bacterium UBA11367]HBE56195.1 hypothetical protein [Cyanobacteria bacterium UBA11366]HBK65987.1 hypothetical protein [Cyanobacteria bacterium UBA11166]HBR75602.1 hypothetical protein [Cyanobacteria bacterium UBA11159]HBS68479.1 hypothetical protein [Cyanobacteria bacterium UBA11153]